MRLRPLVRVAVLLLASLAAACATKAEVERIVARSNALLVAGPDDVSPTGHAAKEEPDRRLEAVEAEVRRIEEFVAGHADDPDLTEPLRLRQALLLARHGQRSLAGDVFARIRREHLHTERDLALHGVREFLPWWYATTPDGTLAEGDLATARAARARFAAVCDALPRESEVRFELEEMRAWISVVLAGQASEAEAAEVLPEAARRFAEHADPREFGAAGPPPPASGSVVLGLRRAYRPKPVFRAMAATARAQGVRVVWEPEWLRAWIGD